jgi:hypothetical protein
VANTADGFNNRGIKKEREWVGLLTRHATSERFFIGTIHSEPRRVGDLVPVQFTQKNEFKQS